MKTPSRATRRSESSAPTGLFALSARAGTLGALCAGWMALATPPANAQTQTQAPAQTQPHTQPHAAQPDAAPKPSAPDHSAYFESGEPQKYAEGLKFAEGPLWWKGEFYCCDLGGGKVYKFTAPERARATHDGADHKADDKQMPADKQADKSQASSLATLSVFRDNVKGPAGIALDGAGNLLTAYFSGKVTRAGADGVETTIAESCAGKQLSKCNDLAVRHDGTIYFSDFGGGESGSKGLFKINPKGEVSLLDDDFEAANGVCLSPDQATLYVADYSANRVIAFDVGEDGAVSGRRVFFDFASNAASQNAGPGTPDGMKTDHAGNLLTTGPGGVWVLSPQGEAIAHVKLRGLSNLAFGGEDGRTLFVTARANVWTLRVREDRAKK